MVKRIITCFLSVCIIFVSFCSAAFADVDYNSYTGTFWDSILAKVAAGSNTLNGLLPGCFSFGGLIAYANNDICAESPDGYHHGSSVSGVHQDENGNWCGASNCSYCGNNFVVYGDDLKHMYQDYVHDNDKDGVTEKSDGSYLLNVPFYGFSNTTFNSWKCSTSNYYSAFLNPFIYYSFDSSVTVSSGSSSITAFSSTKNAITGSNDYPLYYHYKFNLSSSSFVSLYSLPSSYGVDAYNLSGTNTSKRTSSKTMAFYTESSTLSSVSNLTGNISCTVSPNIDYCFCFRDLYVNNSCYIRCYSSPVILSISPLDSQPINVYNTNNNVITVNDTDYTVTSYDYDNRTYTTNTGYSITFGDEQYTIVDNSGNTTNYYYYITYNNDDDPGSGSGSGEGGESGGDGTGCNCTDYTAIINSIAAKIDTLISKMQNIDNDTNDIDLIINNLDTTSENSYLLLQLIYSSLQLVQTDVNTTKDTVNSILTVARTCAENGTITNTKLEDVKTKLDTLIAQGNVTNANLVTIIQGLYDSEQVSWLQRIYQAILSLGSDTDPIEVGEEPEDEEEELDTWDFIRLLRERMQWIFDLQDVFEQLVADVSSDASSAQMVRSGEITRGDLTADHASAPLATNNNMSRSAYTAPELMLSLGSSSKYGVDWGSMSIIDLSWYSEYKDQVDDIISGFLWLAYVWLLIRRAPSIINGGAMVADNVYKIENF